MKITRKCIITGKENTMDLPVTPEELYEWENGELIQNAMPMLSPDEREFIMTGILPETWDNIFGDDE